MFYELRLGNVEPECRFSCGVKKAKVAYFSVKTGRLSACIVIVVLAAAVNVGF